jgi:hypothetical protein
MILQDPYLTHLRSRVFLAGRISDGIVVNLLFFFVGLVGVICRVRLGSGVGVAGSVLIASRRGGYQVLAKKMRFHHGLANGVTNLLRSLLRSILEELRLCKVRDELRTTGYLNTGICGFYARIRDLRNRTILFSARSSNHVPWTRAEK